MYVPLARKYRPKRFSEVVGQEVAVRVLRNAVKQHKLSNAYLFAGPRGTGKTTLARLLAKAVNCLRPQEGEPCGECENCLAVDRGSFPDLVEIDAASNRGIDDVRAIRDAVSYSPIKGKYKLYILDEAHMLTKGAFNALLKTLEEPPPRVLFVLCTTEYERIMPTILSRCQRLLFSKLKDSQIVQHLKNICQKEGIECEERALYLIARLSDGGMRDALSLLDQTSTYGEGRLNTDTVEEFLGILSQEKVRDFLKLLLNSQVDKAIAYLNEINQKGYNLSRFCELLEEEVMDLILYRSLQEPERVVRVEDFHRSMQSVPLSALLYLEKVLNAVRAEARSRDFLRAFELAVVKTQIIKDIVPIGELLKGLSPSPSAKEEAETTKKTDPIELLEGRLDTFTLEVLRRARHEKREDKFLFYIKEGELTQEEINRIKTLEPRIDFVVEAKAEQEGLPAFAEKLKDMFGAKVISHEQRGKGKGPPDKGS
ncbi:MAG: DNA polymerase III subunit gamma/tau [Aquificaceae bacterium]|nr:DNA polymerase III subunit gamma/tau [Aquificaceae bacterium]